MFLVGFIIAGLNYRFSWIILPKPVVIISSVIFIISYILYAEVLRENAYLSRTIEVEENQKVIDTGLYGIVRHPMYATTILLFLAMPLILGSIISLANISVMIEQSLFVAIVAAISMILAGTYSLTYLFSAIWTFANKRISSVSFLPVVHIAVTAVFMVLWIINE